MSATAASRPRSEWSPSTKASVTGPGIAAVSPSSSSGVAKGSRPSGDEEAGLPEVGAIDLVLLTNPHSATEPAEALTAAILASGHPVKSRQD